MRGRGGRARRDVRGRAGRARGELFFEDVGEHGLAAAAALRGAGALGDGFDGGGSVADGGADGAVTHGSTMADDHDSPSVTY